MTLTGASNPVESAIFKAMIDRGADQRFSVIGFEGACHGDSLVFAQFAHPKYSVSLGWPVIAYPSSQAEAEQSLSAVKQALDERRAAGNPVAAIVVEPTNQSHGHVAPNDFISQLHSLARDYDAALIVDEQNTGCGASGQGFWQYSGPADFVAFGKRTQVSGYFSAHSEESNYHVGDSELKLAQFSVIKNAIEKDGLIE